MCFFFVVKYILALASLENYDQRMKAKEKNKNKNKNWTNWKEENGEKVVIFFCQTEEKKLQFVAFKLQVRFHLNKFERYNTVSLASKGTIWPGCTFSSSSFICLFWAAIHSSSSLILWTWKTGGTTRWRTSQIRLEKCLTLLYCSRGRRICLGNGL